MKRALLITATIFLLLKSKAQTSVGQNSFFEDFNDTASMNFRGGSTGTTAAFKVRMGATSQLEKSAKVLSLKIDPQDSAGAGRGPEIISKNFTPFGTYAS